MMGAAPVSAELEGQLAAALPHVDIGQAYGSCFYVHGGMV